MEGDQAGSVRKAILIGMSVAQAPRRIAHLCRLPRTLRYRLALAVGLEKDKAVGEELFLRLPTIQQASVLARLLKEHDENKDRPRK